MCSRTIALRSRTIALRRSRVRLRPASPSFLERLVAADERAQAFVPLAAGGAAVEVRAQAGDGRVGVLAGELDVKCAPACRRSRLRAPRKSATSLDTDE
jgi:hypothetical protein